MDASSSSAIQTPPLHELTPPPGLTPPLPEEAYIAPPLRAIRGMGNLGNTCYLNSAIQALRHCAPFAEYLSSDSWRRWEHPDREGHQLLLHGSALTRALCEPVTAGSVVVPGNFVRTFVAFASKRSDEFYFGAQADTAEALQILLDAYHTQLSREVHMSIRGALSGEVPGSPISQYIKSLESWSTFFRKEYSTLLDLFYGQTQTRLICERCGNISEQYEPWNILKIPIPNATSAGAPAPTLYECITHGLEKETLTDYACDMCAAAEVELLRNEAEREGRELDPDVVKRHTSKGLARKEHAISRYPSHMILCLKRFTNLGQKVRARIPYEEDDINLSPWRAWPSLQPSKDCRYRVYATVEHLGSCRGGHYIMRGRDATDGTWRVYDDARVSLSPIGGAAGPDTYILFLERKQ